MTLVEEVDEAMGTDRASLADLAHLLRLSGRPEDAAQIEAAVARSE